MRMRWMLARRLLCVGVRGEGRVSVCVPWRGVAAMWHERCGWVWDLILEVYGWMGGGCWGCICTCSLPTYVDLMFWFAMLSSLLGW